MGRLVNDYPGTAGFVRAIQFVWGACTRARRPFPYARGFARPRVSPWAIVRRPYRARGVPGVNHFAARTEFITASAYLPRVPLFFSVYMRVTVQLFFPLTKMRMAM